ncbi:MAG: response regulator [Xanthobacteraceae bacterium]|nr:response regulator [Xanthobacteraceae bacterium]MBX3548929.1 response regulator [Xanthobacteraceae bacterium]MCW5678878.1 response regulator [Xanthobacteraceae bacterium]
MPDGLTVYVIDDDDAARDSLQFLLETAGLHAQTYETATAFLKNLPSPGSGCIITDVRMPGMTGIELLKTLKARAFPLPVIVITGHGDIPLAVDAMREGAADFLEKPYNDDALLQSIERAVASMKPAAENDDAKAAILQRIAELSGREAEVMTGLVAGKSNKVIAIELDISPRTVEIYRANVMSKMGADSLPALVRMAITAGLP